MNPKYDQILARFEELTSLISDEKVIRDNMRWRKLAKEALDMTDLVEVTARLKKVEETLADNRKIIAANEDADLVEIARAEMDSLKEEMASLGEKFQLLLVPKDPNDDKNTILEIRAGTGGEESGLFAGDLLRMYTRFVERRGWKCEVLSSNETGVGGFKEVILLVTGAGAGAYGALKYESGVHRVQRVPATEAGVSTPRRRRWRCCQRRKRSKSASTRTSCASTCTDRAVPAGRASTPPIARCALPTFRRVLS